jgi:ABC-type sugar transport system substrate-binding protein
VHVKGWSIAVAALSAVLLFGGVAGAKPAPVRIGVVLNALDNPFFVTIYEGVRVETNRRGARASIRAAASNADLTGQAAHVRSLVRARNDCYVVNPITSTNLVSALRGVARPIVNLDSPIDQTAARCVRLPIRTYIGTNDVAAGKIAGSKMASLLKRGGRVALIGGLADNVNSGLRLRGFERGIHGAGLKVVARSNADYRRTKAQIVAQEMLRDNPRLSGFFAASDLMALGAADAVRAAGKTGRVKIVGMDGIPEALDAVRLGSIDATVSQYPYVMGQMAIEACVAAARGSKLPTRVDAPIAIVTKANAPRAIAGFPHPFRPYSDPFKEILKRP